MIYSVEIKYDETTLTTSAVHQRLKAALGISTAANLHYDRSHEIDELVSQNYINKVLHSKTNKLKLKEIDRIEKCKKTLDLDNVDTKWMRLPGTINDPVEKFQTFSADGSVTVRGVTRVDEKAESVVAYFMNFNSHERSDLHNHANGNL